MKESFQNPCNLLESFQNTYWNSESLEPRVKIINWFTPRRLFFLVICLFPEYHQRYFSEFQLTDNPVRFLSPQSTFLVPANNYPKFPLNLFIHWELKNPGGLCGLGIQIYQDSPCVVLQNKRRETFINFSFFGDPPPGRDLSYNPLPTHPILDIP